MDPASPPMEQASARSEQAARGALKDRKLRRLRRVATGLFVVAALVYVLTTAYGRHPAWGYVAAFSEAAMIGALADWFAVVALFRHPLNFKFIPHTAILPRNKQRIATGIAEFIQFNFLSPQAIVARIAAFGPAAKLREWLLRRENAEKIASVATRLLSYALGAFDDERVRRFLHGAVTAKLREVDIASMAGDLMDVLTEKRRHHAILDETLRLVDEALGREETRAFIARAVAAESGLVEAVRRLGWNLDETIARRIVSGVARAIAEVRNDPKHPLRERFDAFIADFIARLKTDAATRAKVQQLRDELVANPAFSNYIGELWQEFRAWLDRDLADEQSRVHAAIVDLAGSLGEKLAADPAMQRWIDEQILKAIPALVEENRARIGRFVEDLINEWHEDKFVAELEREIGPDLQYIRINGTLVGGLAGLLIYSASRFLAG